MIENLLQAYAFMALLTGVRLGLELRPHNPGQWLGLVLCSAFWLPLLIWALIPSRA